MRRNVCNPCNRAAALSLLNHLPDCVLPDYRVAVQYCHFSAPFQLFDGTDRPLHAFFERFPENRPCERYCLLSV